jgi:biopolymer transport protein ExbB
MLDFLWTPYRAVNDLIEGGGPFVFFIFATGIILLTLTIERYWYFSRVLPKEAEQYLAIWRARSEHQSWCARAIRQTMITKLNQGMSANQIIMKTLVPLSPLLGLIGTVSGMLEVFESMALRGTADARTMASGVSHAMICPHRPRGEHHRPVPGLLLQPPHAARDRAARGQLRVLR